ncbi:4-amino-4-deoxy-L-arabinose transferase-like glycosyltransferase [Balneicella halophila]|uniref:4-amino-4-deoxy-L-arabinose transferase-like glycosyltransferase n=1 Tax=Balneicella halophila TaxID=1537566 RepID=A0A7L4UQP2_BALHA|nr:phospholipid carrier-dependent glycosyltransferase [Balneicella halophila]PVX51761.1 4-amino-4-deoxy-L-arabinose transferase-like glycosyltransferase [Balneicella halophila]
MEQREYWYKIIICIVGILLYIVNLDTMAVEIMEARNLVTVREMLQSGDWQHPTMNGVLRLEKPPLPTWITAISASIFGLKNLFFLRLPAALMSIWLLFSMNSLVKRLTNDKLLAMLSAISLAGMLYVVMLGRRETWDIYTHSFMLAAIVQFVAMLQSVRPLRNALCGGILFGAAFLSKGPVSLYALFLPFVLIYCWQYRPLFGKSKRAALAIYIIIAFIISASWFVFLQLSLGNEAKEVLEGEVNNWHSYNVKPWYYYIKDYPVHSGLWTLILAIGLFTKYNYNKLRDKKAFSFFWLWTVASILLLSIIPEKKVRYLLPTFIPASFLVGSYFYYLIKDYERYKKPLDTVILKIHTVIFMIVAVALPIGIYMLFYRTAVVGWITVAGVCLMSLFCIYLLWKVWSSDKKHILIVGAILLLSSAILFFVPNSKYMLNPQFHSIGEVQKIQGLEGLPGYALEETRIELIWWTGRKIKEVQNLDGLQPPYMLLTNEKPTEYNLPSNYELIGHYDNNSKPEGHKYHHKSLSKYVVIVR